MDSLHKALAFFGLHRDAFMVGAGLFILTLAGSVVAMTSVLVRLPERYLQMQDDEVFWPHRPMWLRVSARIGKNILGVLLVVLGIVLSLPGVPGQGVLTILIGVMLVDFPGKRRVERRILGRRRVLAAVNRLRARFGRPPLEAPASPPVTRST